MVVECKLSKSKGYKYLTNKKFYEVFKTKWFGNSEKYLIIDDNGDMRYYSSKLFKQTIEKLDI